MRIDPNRMIFQMRPKQCGKCGETQWSFFMSPQDYNTWVCPCEKVGKEEITKPIPEGN